MGPNACTFAGMNMIILRSAFAFLFTSMTCLFAIGQGSIDLIKKGSGNVHAILQDRKGELWFGTTDQGLFRYDGKAFTRFSKKDGLSDDGIFSMMEDRKGGIWIGTGIGLTRYDGKRFEKISLAFGKGGQPYTSGNNAVTAMLEDRKGMLWFGTDSGVYRFDGKNYARLLDDPGLVNEKGITMHLVQQMIQDRNGIIWITTKLDGICRYDGKMLTHFMPDREPWFRGLVEDKQGCIWAGTRYRGVYRFDGGDFKKVSLDKNFDTYTVLSIVKDRSGDLWFGTEAGDDAKRDIEGGVWRYDGRSMLNLSKPGDLEHPAVWSLLFDKAGNLWIGTRKTGLTRWDGKTFKRYSE